MNLRKDHYRSAARAALAQPRGGPDGRTDGRARGLGLRSPTDRPPAPKRARRRSGGGGPPSSSSSSGPGVFPHPPDASLSLSGRAVGRREAASGRGALLRPGPPSEPQTRARRPGGRPPPRAPPGTQLASLLRREAGGSMSPHGAPGALFLLSLRLAHCRLRTPAPLRKGREARGGKKKNEKNKNADNS